jgi:hypothetical protein
MRNPNTLCMLIVAGLLLPAIAKAESASGPGGPIPDYGGGGVWPYTIPPDTIGYSSPVQLQLVASVKSITLTGIQHYWVGDLQVALFDPDGRGYNILVRPGFTGAGFGSSADLDGDYVFVDPGSAPAFPASIGLTEVSPGTYSQYFGVWPDGAADVFNTPLSAVSGPAGTWKLRIIEWAGGGGGSIDGWAIEYNVPAPGAAALIALAAAATKRRRRGCAVVHRLHRS